MENTGTAPDNLLLATLNSLMRSSLENSGGIWPVRWLLSSIRTLIKVQLAMPGGIEPVRVLLERSRVVMNGKTFDMLEGMGPER